MAILKIKDDTGNIIDIPAIRGKSSYEYAQEGGFKGTEEEFKSLLGGLQDWADNALESSSNVSYATCDTEAEIAEKTVTISNNDNWKLNVGTVVMIYFSISNSASNVKLNVNGTGAYPIWYNNAEYTSTGTAYTGYAKRVIVYMFNGTHWVWISSSYDTNTTYTNASLGQGYVTCSTDASTTAKVGALSSYKLVTGGIVSVKFTNAVPANATLNVNSTGAKNIYYRGAKITADVIKAGDVATFVYSSQYHLISIDRWQNDITSLEETIVDHKTQIDDELDGMKVTIVQEVLAQLGGDSNSVFGKVNADGTITITTDLENGVYTLMYENEDGTLTEVGTITVGEVATYYSITRTLTNCTSNKATINVEEGSAWTETLTANDGYKLSSVVVTMGGTDVTSSVYSDGVITISEVTGDIRITATTSELVSSLPITWLDGYTCKYTVGQAVAPSASGTYIISEEIPVEYGTTYTLTIACTDNSTLKFVGVDSGDIVTEAKDYTQANGKTYTYEWTPTRQSTTGLRLRSYSSAKAGLMATTQLNIK